MLKQKTQEKLPTVSHLIKNGEFLGYDQYDEVYQLNNRRFILLDYVDKDKKVCYNVHRWYGNKADLRKGYHEITGEPL